MEKNYDYLERNYWTATEEENVIKYIKAIKQSEKVKYFNLIKPKLKIMIRNILFRYFQGNFNMYDYDIHVNDALSDLIIKIFKYTPNKGTAYAFCGTVTKRFLHSQLIGKHKFGSKTDLYEKYIQSNLYYIDDSINNYKEIENNLVLEPYNNDIYNSDSQTLLLLKDFIKRRKTTLNWNVTYSIEYKQLLFKILDSIYEFFINFETSFERQDLYEYLHFKNYNKSDINNAVGHILFSNHYIKKEIEDDDVADYFEYDIPIDWNNSSNKGMRIYQRSKFIKKKYMTK